MGVSAWPSWDKAHADVYVFFFQPKFLHAIILARNCSISLSSVSSLIELGLWRKLGHSVQSPSRSVIIKKINERQQVRGVSCGVLKTIWPRHDDSPQEPTFGSPPWRGQRGHQLQREPPKQLKFWSGRKKFHSYYIFCVKYVDCVLLHKCKNGSLGGSSSCR